MEWYYAINDQRMGPVSEAEFSRLVELGEIRPEMLVWREGMASWQPLREVHVEAPSKAAVCSECGTVLPEDELISVDDRLVCAACKPEFLQRVREGVAPVASEQLLSEKSLTFQEVLSLGWKLWLRNFGVILALTLLTAIPSNIVIEAMPAPEEPTWQEFGRIIRVTMLMELLLGSISVVGTAFVIQESLAGRTVTFGAAFQHALSRWPAAIGTGLLENIILLLLFLLLIVPGVIWMGYYTFAFYAVALRGLAGKPALDYSKNLVRGQWWRVVGIVIALILITSFPVMVVVAAMPGEGIGSIISGTIADVLVSYMTVALCVLFLNLDSLKNATDRKEF